jgi:putative transposase
MVRGADVRRVFETIMPDSILLQLARSSKLQERERKLDAVALLRSMIVAAATGYGGRQADVMRLYFEGGADSVVRGGFYRWFGSELEAVMVAVRDLALKYARALPRDLPGVLGAHVTDWHIVDSSTVKLHRSLISEYPGTGNYAALKVHKRFSVGLGTAIDYHLSPAREHDNTHLTIDESWSGLGVLLDLGYASFKLIRDCNKHGVHFVIRLKDSWKPKVQHVSRGSVTKTFLAGSDLDGLIADETILLDGRVVDVDVSFGEGKATVHCRMVGVPTPEGSYRFYLTGLPSAVGPRQVADLYRVRWEIESDNKLDKSCLHLDEIGARTGPAVRALVHASLVSSIIACLLAHHHRLDEIPPPHEGAERKTPPIHTQALALAMGSAANTIAAAMDLRGTKADVEWDRIAGYLVHLGKDPNWRRSPSVLDQMRGWKITPGRPKKSKMASAPPSAN